MRTRTSCNDMYWSAYRGSGSGLRRLFPIPSGWEQPQGEECAAAAEQRVGRATSGNDWPRSLDMARAISSPQRHRLKNRSWVSGLRRTWLVGIGGFFLVSLLLQGCAGPGPQSADSQAAAASEVGAAAELPYHDALRESDYRIGPNDLLEISVLGVDDLGRTVRVNTSGGVSMPLIGMVHVAGLTSSEAEAMLKDEYEKDYLQDAQISVFIQEFTSQRFTVDGAVSKPGVYPLIGKMTLLRALATAGGKGELADLQNVMLFRVNEDGETEKKKFDVLRIRSGEEADPVLQRDDVVVVNQNAARVTFRDSLFKDIIDTLNPFSSTYYNVDSGAR